MATGNKENRERILIIRAQRHSEKPDRTFLEVSECYPEITKPGTGIGRQEILNHLEDGFQVLIRPKGNATNPVRKERFDWTETMGLLEEGKSVVIQYPSPFE